MPMTEFNPPYTPRMAPFTLAQLFVDMFGDHFVWCYDRGILMTYIADRVDQRWAHDPFGNGANYDRLHDNAAAFLSEMVEIYNPADADGNKPAKLVGRQLYDFKYAADVVHHVRVKLADRVRYAEKFVLGHEDIWGLPNAQVLNLLTSKIEPMRLDHYLDRRSTIAPDKDCPTPAFDEFMQRICLGDVELIQYHMRWAGYCLTGHISEEAMAFWLGEQAANGKTTLANIYRRIWRSEVYYTPVNFLSLAESNANSDEMQMRTIGGLAGARVAVAMEGKRKVAFDQALFNKLTSKDELRGKFLFENPFSFIPTHKLIVGSNYEPILQVDEAAKRRLHLVPFDARFLAKEDFTGEPGTFLKDGDFSQKLERELPGIFHKFVVGCMDWREHGLDKPRAVTARTDAYWGAADVFGEWEREHRAEPDLFTETKALYRSYEQFMEGRGKAMRPEDFGSELRRRGYKSAQPNLDGKRPHGYLGLKP